MTVHSTRALLALALSALVTGAAIAASPPPAAKSTAQPKIDPKADQLLKQMTEYLSHLQTFRVRAESTDEVVSTEGQKLQVLNDSEVTVARPNRLRSENIGDEAKLEFVYDGQKMSLACRADGTYATVPAPKSLDETIDLTRKKYQIDAPGADLLYAHPYEILTEQVKSGQFIGRETIDGITANHLAFRGDDVDWQIWIQDGPKPVPLRFNIVSKKVTGQPEFTVRLSRWEPEARIDATAFNFQPPPTARKVDSFPTQCGAAKQG